jgi:hypothetical protein
LGTIPVVARQLVPWVGLLSTATWTAPSYAASSVRAAVTWQGECDDRPALADEARARGAEVDFAGPEHAALKLGVRVATGTTEFLARVELESDGARETREVAARECAELRRAVAWVLVVFAEERAAAAQPGKPPEASFPAPLAPTLEKAAEPSAAAPATRPAAATTAAKTCAGRREHWQAGVRLVTAFGFVPSPSIGPNAFGRFRPCSPWLAGLELSALYLTTLGYERDGRSLTVRRVAGRGTGWFGFGVPWLEIGAAVEAGQLSASASTSAAGPGYDDSTGWLAFGIPVAARVILLPGVFSAEAALEGLYAPAAYSLRYASGESLAESSQLEFRAALGVAAHF